jgi:hypothetical protein
MTTTSDGPDIHVRRCTVRVRRRGGWSWGDPAAYVDPAVAAIENALHRAVAEAALPDEADVTLGGSVTLDVTSDGHVTPESLQILVDRLREAAAASSAEVAELSPVPPIERDTTVGTIAATLARWSRSGRLDALTGFWSASALDAWVSALLAATESAVGGTTELSSAVVGIPTGLSSEAVGVIAAAVLGDAPDKSSRPDQCMRFLVLAGAVAAALGDRTPDRATLTHIARHAGLPTGHAATSPSREPNPLPALRTSGPAVVPALPFLILVQLYRLGYLEPATAALLAADVPTPAASYAAAVAGKVLDPPERGWRRKPDERLAVELVSGLTSEQVDAAASRWADQSEVLLPPLRSALVELYDDGRSRHDEVVRTGVGEDVIYGEALGLLPISWSGSPGQSEVVLAQLGDPPVRDSDVLAPLVEAIGPRRGLPGHDKPELERLLGAVVGTALGSLAQELWGEDADAIVALQRLQDLEAQVTVRDRVTVAVPRGQRWLDLRRAGLLETWPAPWVPGGLWELMTW